jgi:hypothetical protein
MVLARTKIRVSAARQQSAVVDRGARGAGRMWAVFTVHGTQKLLRRIGQPSPAPETASASTALDDWYATIVPWRRPVALFVNEPTLLPVLLPLAPSASLLARFPDAVTATLATHNVDPAVVAKERDEMREWWLAKTANRSVVGIMNEFTYLADAWGEPIQVELILASRSRSRSPRVRQKSQPQPPGGISDQSSKPAPVNRAPAGHARTRRVGTLTGTPAREGNSGRLRRVDRPVPGLVWSVGSGVIMVRVA